MKSVQVIQDVIQSGGIRVLAEGAALLLILGASFFLLWSWFNSGRTMRALCLLAVLGLGLRAYSAADRYLHDWDERYHAVVAKNMIGHPLHPTLYENPLLPYDPKDWVRNHTWVHKQPFALWCMALSMATFGISEWAMRLPSVILSTLMILAVYGTGKELFGERAGLAAAFFAAINGLLIGLSAGQWATDHVDTFFASLTAISVYCSVRLAKSGKPAWCVATGVTLGLTLLSKHVPGLIVLPVWLLTELAQGRAAPGRLAARCAIIVAIAAAIFAPWQVYIRSAFPVEAAWESEYNFRHLFEPLEGHAGDWTFHFAKLKNGYGELVYIAIGWVLYRCRRDGKLELAAILAWFVVPLIFFTFAATKMKSYMLISSGAVSIMLGLFFAHLDEARRSQRYRLPATALMILTVLLTLKFWTVRPFVHMERSRPWADSYRELASSVDSKTVVFNVRRPVCAMFYTAATAYDTLPDPETLTSLQARGWRVLVNTDGREPVPAEIANLPAVELIQL